MSVGIGLDKTLAFPKLRLKMSARQIARQGTMMAPLAGIGTKGIDP